METIRKTGVPVKPTIAIKASTMTLKNSAAIKASTSALLRGREAAKLSATGHRGTTARGSMSPRTGTTPKPSIQQLDREKRDVERKIGEFMRKDEKPKAKETDDVEKRTNKRKPFEPVKKESSYWIIEKAA